MPVEPARATELLQALAAARSGYLAAPACERLELFLAAAGNEVAAIATWASAQAHAEAGKGPAAAPFFKIVMDLTSGPPEIRQYEPWDG